MNFFKEGDIVIRKNKKAKIIKIHHNMNPPSVDVMMIESGNFVNTEFSKLSLIPPKGPTKKKRKKNNRRKRN